MKINNFPKRKHAADAFKYRKTRLTMKKHFLIMELFIQSYEALLPLSFSKTTFNMVFVEMGKWG